MKYLLRFNESSQDIQDFCELHLSYLIDEGYALDIRKCSTCYQIDFVKPSNRGRWAPGAGGHVDWMYWEDIKDRFIPFLTELQKNYSIDRIVFQYPGQIKVNMNTNDIINDNIITRRKVNDNRYIEVFSSIRITIGLD